MVTFCAVLCDCDSFTDMEDSAQTHLAWLRGFLVLENGAPSHDVFRNVFLALRPQALLDILTGWCGELSGKHIAIDGKTLRGTHDAEQGRHLVHLVRAWVDTCSLSARQVVCAEKSNEIEANQKGALQAMEALFKKPAQASPASVRQHKSETLELSHGRCEKRCYSFIDDLA